ncbi:MAG: hypothetical protein LBU23_03595 [Planctomycetota bacterium]|jgi:hypothetical protein|nr:hypothetical protein [Planctomycetota bacterium]
MPLRKKEDRHEEERSRIVAATFATKAERQAFWTRLMEDESLKIRDRLRAAEPLAKSEGDFLPREENHPTYSVSAMFEWATREKDAETKAKEDAEVAVGKRYRLGKDDELGPADQALFDLWDQPTGEGGLEEVLRKSAELEKIAMADRKAKKSKCPPIGNTEEAEPAAPPPEKPGEMPKPANAAPKPETAKCPPIKKTGEAEPAAEAPEKPGETAKTASAAPMPETTKCPPIGKTGEAEPAAEAPAARRPKPPGIFYPPAEEEVGIRVGSFPACATCLLDLD